MVYTIITKDLVQTDGIYSIKECSQNTPSIEDLTVPLRTIIEELESNWVSQKRPLNLSIVIKNEEVNEEILDINVSCTYLEIQSNQSSIFYIFSYNDGRILIINREDINKSGMLFADTDKATVYIFSKYSDLFKKNFLLCDEVKKNKKRRIKKY